MSLKIEYHVIDVLDKKFIIIPETLLFFEHSEEVEQIINLYNEYEREDILKQYDSDKVDEVVDTLDQLNEIYLEIQKYRKDINDYSKNKKQINSIEINIANACNLNCRYCFAGDGTHGKHNIMSVEQAKRVVDFFIEKSGVEKELNISIIGGEPLVNKEVFKYILEYAFEEASKRDKKVQFATTTNGTLLDEDIVHLLDKFDVRVMLSMDSNNKEVNDYLRPMRSKGSAYELIREKGWKILLDGIHKRAIRSTITPYNLNFFEDAKAYYDAGFYHVHLEEVKSEAEEFKFTEHDVEILKQEFEKLTLYLIEQLGNGEKISSKPLLYNMSRIHHRRPKVKYCGVLSNSFAVSPDMNIYPCDGMMWDKYIMGSVDEGINEEKLQEYKNRIDVLKEKKNECMSCWARYLCGGGCALQYFEAEDAGKKTDCRITLFKYGLELYLYYRLQQINPSFFDKLR